MRKTKQPRAVGYVRVSTEEQANEGISLDAQVEKVRAYAALHDLELVAVIEDRGESAKDLDRPGVRKVLKMIEAGEVNALIIYKLDRLTRSPRDLYMLVDDLFNPRDVDLVSITEHIDTRTPAGRAMIGMMSVFAQMERELIADRTRLALAHKKAMGERLGRTPLGFDTPDDRKAAAIPNPDELEAVAFILRRRRGRGAVGYSTIARELNEAGMRTKEGKRWRPYSVQRVWRARDRYLGVITS